MRATQRVTLANNFAIKSEQNMPTNEIDGGIELLVSRPHREQLTCRRLCLMLRVLCVCLNEILLQLARWHVASQVRLFEAKKNCKYSLPLSCQTTLLSLNRHLDLIVICSKISCFVLSLYSSPSLSRWLRIRRMKFLKPFTSLRSRMASRGFNVHCWLIIIIATTTSYHQQIYASLFAGDRSQLTATYVYPVRRAIGVAQKVNF